MGCSSCGGGARRAGAVAVARDQRPQLAYKAKTATGEQLFSSRDAARAASVDGYAKAVAVPARKIPDTQTDTGLAA